MARPRSDRPPPLLTTLPLTARPFCEWTPEEQAGHPRLSANFSDLLGALCAKTFHTAPTIPSFVGGDVVFVRQALGVARGERVVYRLVWSVVCLSHVSFAERRAFGVERARLCVRCSWVSASMLLGVRRGPPLEVHQFEKVGHLRRSGSVKYPPSCAHPTGARGVAHKFL